MSNCKHADSLIVQRNDGFRWVTCTECHTDFIPDTTEDLVAALVAKEAGEVVETDRHMDASYGYSCLMVLGRGRYYVVALKEE